MKLKKMLIFTFDVTDTTERQVNHLLEAVPGLGEIRNIPVQTKVWSESPPKLCENCGQPDPHNDHWDDLDGPNRAGWACPR